MEVSGMTNSDIALARRFWMHVHEGGTLTTLDVGRMVTALEETFQMYVDANEARIDAEAKLQDQTHLIEQLFTLLEKTEETDDGRVFHPNQLRSCRVADTEKLETILAGLKGGKNE